MTNIPQCVATDVSYASIKRLVDENHVMREFYEDRMRFIAHQLRLDVHDHRGYTVRLKTPLEQQIYLGRMLPDVRR